MLFIINSEYYIDLFKESDIFIRRIRSEVYDRNSIDIITNLYFIIILNRKNE